MAEFLDKTRHYIRAEVAREPVHPEGDGYNAYGYPVPEHRKQAAYDHAKAMGCTDKALMIACIGHAVAAIERDQPYEAMAALAGQLVDLIGAYRLLAVLLTAEKPSLKESK